MTNYKLELEGHYVTIEMNEFEDNIAQIFKNNDLIAEYKFSEGSGAIKINHLNGKAIIDLLAALLYEQADITVEKAKVDDELDDELDYFAGRG